MIKANLKSIQAWLKGKEFDCSIVEKSEYFSDDRLFINLEYPEEEYPMILQLTITAQDLSEIDKLFGIKKKAKQYDLLDFYLGFPIQVDEKLAGDMLTLTSTFDHGLELPGLKYHPGRRQVVYHYRYFTTKGLIDTRILLTIISFVQMVTVTVGPILVSVGTGEKSLEMALKELRELADSTEE
ncbi:Uncharacterized protein SCG7086_AA_00350 [Chlamydiales bacterium SCGC AG-110-P3]|nr:Uncharacterized protein SCG7086_AA_00350 [Chlamydiales bacterium SCGC AG-110-P3]